MSESFGARQDPPRQHLRRWSREMAVVPRREEQRVVRELHQTDSVGPSRSPRGPTKWAPRRRLNASSLTSRSRCTAKSLTTSRSGNGPAAAETRVSRYGRPIPQSGGWPTTNTFVFGSAAPPSPASARDNRARRSARPTSRAARASLAAAERALPAPRHCSLRRSRRLPSRG